MILPGGTMRIDMYQKVIEEVDGDLWELDRTRDAHTKKKFSTKREEYNPADKLIVIL